MDDRPLKTVVKGAGIFFIGMLFSKFFNYFFRLIAARLGTDTYGVITLGLSFVSVLAVIATLGLNNGILRYVPFYHSKNDEKKVRGVILYSLKVSAVFGGVIGSLLFLFSNLISRNFFPNINQALFPSVLKVVAFTLPLTAVLFILFATFEAFKMLKYEIYTKNIFDGAFKLALSFLVVYLGYGAMGIIFIYLASVIGSVVISFYYLNRIFSLFSSRVEYIKKELLYYSLPLVLSGLCVILISSIDTWIIGFFTNASQVGIYNAAMPTAQLIYFVPTIIVILFLPVISELYAKNDAYALKGVFTSVTKWIFFITLPLAFVFVFFSKQILGLLFGSAYLPAALPLSILSLGFFSSSLLITSEKMLMVFKKTKFILVAYLITLVVNTILNLALVPVFGINGAAVASGSSYLLLGLIFLFGNYRFTKTLPFDLSYLKALFSAVISFGLIYIVKYLVNYDNVYFTFILIALFSLSYLAMLLLLKSFDKEDKMIFNSVQHKVLGYVQKR